MGQGLLMKRLIFQSLSLFVILQMVQKSMAYDFKVGGFNGWMPPPDPNSNIFNQWAQKNRFQIGDSLVFVYSANKDSVLYVNQNDYLNCNTSNPIQKFTDGQTIFKLDHSGPYYFISGVRDNCLKNEKLSVIVLANRSTPAASSSSPPPPAPSPSPPPPSNSTATPPSPAPAGQASPPPSPAPASDETQPKKNGAIATSTNSLVLMGALVGLTALSVF